MTILLQDPSSGEVYAAAIDEAGRVITLSRALYASEHKQALAGDWDPAEDSGDWDADYARGLALHDSEHCDHCTEE